MEKSNRIRKKYFNVALKFLNKMKSKHKIICMLITGSYYQKNLTKFSDLDIFLITNNSSHLREKGTQIIDGIKVSYFLNPYWKIKESLLFEKGRIKRPTSEFIYFSECIYGIKEIERLKKLAKISLNSKIQKIDKKEITYLGWKLYDKSEVLKRKNYNSLNKEYLKHDLFNFCIEIFFLLKRSYKPHTKYTLEKIEVLDKQFYNILKRFLKNDSNFNLLLLSSYLLNLLNFKSKDYFKRTKATNFF